ncbi:hypothetical protein OG455_24430 [Kitasatospora sp. NBC_01287]|uniref:hypothetical protein n=1 Tax=Kitasatospora sp. NBC_01287 TaxID=2903573 RepID=UPI002256DC10|nr:hypothetical protein [Kitasatospora sp. NBC_01287]MCX4748627.1 hypothetical protein [Kitasatospora sp. NBC_01287]
MFESERWPLLWTGFLLIAVSVRLAVTVRGRRYRRPGSGRRPSHLEWLPGLAGLIMVADEAPRLLRASGAVLTAGDDLAGVAGAAVLGLLLYGGSVVARRPRG